MSENLDESVMRDIVVKAHNYAITYGHEYVTAEHVLMACMTDDFVQNMFTGIMGDYTIVIANLDQYLTGGDIPKTSTPRPRQTTLSIKILQNAIHQVIRSGRKKLNAYDVVIAISEYGETQASYIISSYNIDHLTLKAYVTHNKQSIKEELTSDGNPVTLKPSKNNKKMNVKQAKEILEQFTINFNEEVKAGRIDPLIGRKKEIFNISKVLCRRKKNNVLIVGEPGVGKTALAEGLAYRIVNKDIPEILETAVVYSLEVGTIMAGSKYRGDLEERLQNIIQAIITVSEEENIKSVLFIDEIHMIIGAGAGSDAKALDISNLLKPALQKGVLRAIGSTTYAEYRKHFEKDAALLRRFQRIDVGEPSVEEAIEIIKGLKSYYEEYHNITYTDQAVEEAVKLSAKYIHKNHLPDKALDVIDSAGARNKVVAKEDQVTELTVTEIIEEIASISNVPVSKLSSSENDKLEMLEPNLKSVIYGQDEAIESLISAVLIARAGMRDLNKPEAAFLFNGPTGVGKTEVAKQLAKLLDMHFERFDMSEYMEKHSVSKLIGAPPGYVGYDENGGKLINVVDSYPNSVILLDEIEKAHPDVFNILLQVMDNGRLTNSQNKEVRFNNTIIIITGNIGSAQAAKKKIGFGNNDNSSVQEEEINKIFAPEFRNRLDGIVTFNKLSIETCELVLNKFINELNIQLGEKKIVLELSDEAKEELLESGFDADMGARPLARVIHNRIKKPLAPKMLFGDLKNGGKVIVGYNVDMKEFTFDIELQKESVQDSI